MCKSYYKKNSFDMKNIISICRIEYIWTITNENSIISSIIFKQGKKTNLTNIYYGNKN